MSVVSDDLFAKRLAARQRMTAALTAVGIGPDDGPCADGSCIFGSPPGMHTNGGCQCLKRVCSDPVTRNMVRRLATALRIAIEGGS